MRVRSANSGDVSAITNLERQNPTAARWSQQKYERLFAGVDTQAPFERLCWVVESEQGQERASREEPGVLAFLVARKIDTEWELENLVVTEKVRRRGIGTLLLRELIAHARAEHGNAIFLEVRASNHTARALYHRLGFEEKGLRKSYYAGPVEDAILCLLRFS